MHRLWVLLLLAFVVMCLEDFAYTLMTISEAHFQALKSAVGDQLGYTMSSIGIVLGLGEFIRTGKLTRRGLELFAATSVGNVVGTYTSVVFLGHLVAH